MPRITIVTKSDRPPEGRGWTAQLGVALIILGVLALIAIATRVAGQEMLFGWLILVSGVAEAVHAFYLRRSEGFFMHVIPAIAALPIVLLVAARLSGAPATEPVVWMLLFSSYLIIIGAFRIVSGIRLKFPGWTWAELDGTVTLLLGIMLRVSWFGSEAWAPGLALSVSFFLRGWSLVMFAWELRRSAEPVNKQARIA